ncbi:putative LRR receptor-like serine/threonine-protein kinase [Abeliophyllum distichum]|uniref:non-specific serine/threonine protein kinase n=1 Tax=Abeliophyllum distichum TaxID=126358 RepID=A0ABD1PDP4_9LAMI
MYQNIIEATEDFSSRHCVGVGGCGSVFKAELDGHVVAIKKLYSSEGEVMNLKSFKNEIEALTKLRHHNIVKLYGFCSHSRHSLLVNEFVEGGSLESILCNDEKAKEFEWNKRENVVKEVANALSYMHHNIAPPIVHRDTSSKNILLDFEQEVHIANFGTTKILKLDSSNWISFAGTFGYAAPELTFTMEFNEKCDVYSFRVLALEVIMGKHPGDLILSNFTTSTSFEPSTSASQIMSTVHDIFMKDMLDQRLSIPTGHEAEQVVAIAKLALACIHPTPQLRPSIEQTSGSMSSWQWTRHCVFTGVAKWTRQCVFACAAKFWCVKGCTCASTAKPELESTKLQARRSKKNRKPSFEDQPQPSEFQFMPTPGFDYANDHVHDSGPAVYNPEAIDVVEVQPHSMSEG